MYLLSQMTGLDIDKDEIIEMACIITDSDLNIIAEVGEMHCRTIIDKKKKQYKSEMLFFS